MFIKLTNASPAHQGKPFLIRKDLVATVYPVLANRDDLTVEDVTMVFAPPHGTWEVKETVEEIHALLSSEHSNGFPMRDQEQDK